MRTLAIGDIHGCSKALAALLRYVRPDPDDLLVFLGDYIDRGPDSRGVINQLLQVAGRCHTVFLRGNHEVMLLAAREDPLKASNWLSCGGLEALVSYEAQFRDDWRAGIPEPHWRFFETTVRAHETAHHIFVHAGLDHGADLEAQPDWLLFWAVWDQMHLRSHPPVRWLSFRSWLHRLHRYRGRCRGLADLPRRQFWKVLAGERT